MADVPQIFDRDLLFARRARLAARQNAQSLPDFLLRHAAEDLVDRLGLIKRDFALGLNLGAYHGVIGQAVGVLSNVGQMIALERDRELLTANAGLKVLGDEEALPFRDGVFDLVVSVLALQYVNDLPGTLAQIRRVLKPDGLFLGVVLGGQTLRELRQVTLEVESEHLGGASPRVAPFADVRDAGGLLQRAGFALPVADADLVTVTYASPIEFLQELRAMGAGNVLRERSRRPMTRGLLMKLAETYHARFSGADHRIPASFELVTLTGWVPHESQQKPLKPGSAAMRLAEALQTEERSAGEKAGKS